MPLGDTLPGAEVVPSGQMALFAEEEFNLERGDGQAALPVQGKLPAGFEQGGDFLTVQDEEMLRRVAERLDGVYEFAFDTETDGLDPHAAQLVGLSVAWERGPEGAAYIPVGHREGQQLPWDVVREALKPAFSRPDVRMVAHNAGFDMAVLQRYGLPVRGQLADTMVAELLLEPGSRALGLKDIAWTRLRIEMTPITELIGTGKTQHHHGSGAGGGSRALRQRRRRRDTPPRRRAAARAPGEGAVTSVPRSGDAPHPGAAGDGARRRASWTCLCCSRCPSELTARMHDLEGQICQIAGYAFNVNSTQQLSDMLFGKLGLPTQGLKRTQAGAYRRPPRCWKACAAGTRWWT